MDGGWGWGGKDSDSLKSYTLPLLLVDEAPTVSGCWRGTKLLVILQF